MSFLRCIAILTILVFCFLTVIPSFAQKYSGDGHYVTPPGWVSAYAYAYTTDVADAGFYSILAEVDVNSSSSSGNYQGKISESVSASSSVLNPAFRHFSHV